MWVTPKTLTQRQDKKKIGNEEAGEVIQRTSGTLKWKREWTRVQETEGQENLTQHTFKTVIISSTALYANF